MCIRDSSRPKVLESAARAPKIAMREAWLKSKEKTVLGLKETPFAGQNEESSNTPADSAANQTVSGMKTAAQKGADLTYRGGKKLAQTASRKVRGKREASRVIKEAKDAAGQTGKAVKDTVSKTRIKNTAAKTIKGKPQKAVKTAGRSIKGVKQGAKSVKTCLLYTSGSAGILTIPTSKQRGNLAEPYTTFVNLPNFANKQEAR